MKSALANVSNITLSNAAADPTAFFTASFAVRVVSRSRKLINFRMLHN